MQGRTYAGPRKPRSASEALGILDLYEAPDFPDNVPPLIRDVIERKRIELDFSVAALTELEAALQRKRAVHLGTKGIGYVVLYFGETLRRDVGGTWVVEDSRYGQELRIRAPSGKVIDFALDLGHSLDEPGPTTFMWYFRMCKERIR